MIDDYGDMVLKTAYMYLKDMHRAEDAFQEVFIKAFKNYSSFRGESSEKTWIIKITINVCRDILKSFWNKRVIHGYEDILSISDNNAEEEAIENMGKQELFSKVLSLPAAYREAIILYYYHEFSTIEVSRILDIPEGTVRSRLSRGREMLKKYIIKGEV